MTLNILLGMMASWQILIMLAIFVGLVILPKIISRRGSNANHSDGNSTLTEQKLGMTFFGNSGREKLRVFESRMKECGFTKRIVVFDFFSENDKSMNKTDNLHQWAVGIWVNYQKKLVSLRLEGNSSNEIFIPFDKIQSVEIKEDGFTKSTENFFGTAVNSRGYSTGLQVRIVIGDINSGITPYILKLYDPTVGQGPNGVPSRLDKSSSIYRSLLECAKSINDEIAFIMNNSR